MHKAAQRPALRARTWAIVVGAGSGARYGAAKQFELLGDERVLDRSCRIAATACDGVVVVVPADAAEAEAARLTEMTVVAGGATRTASVRAGLAAVPADAKVICVHDAARPLASAELYQRVVAAVADGADAAVPGVPVTDTVKQTDPASRVVATPDRASLAAVQTPQAFAAPVLRAAHADPELADDPAVTDDAAMVERRGGTVVVVPGEPANRKITHPDDLAWAHTQLGSQPDRARPAAGSVRVGQGFDIHAHTDDPTRELVLGGCRFPGAAGLAGHSDADVPAHAAADALLGAAGLGDLGTHFPDTDPRWAGADSLQLLGHVAELVRAAGWQIGNVDVKVVCEQPKLAPRRAEMETNLSAAAGAPVTVSGRRAEGLGALGRHEGIAAWAVAVITSTGGPA
ncbi:MAG TPA: 2-C-methyl-D-erythritol 4-phosphate cytidylyltransferase [Ilumatobacter sp.]|nr:2-C-methyl-D-erythritol 4-phosphate cytidylyltransferase [Ilumatobacter sp.]